MGGEPGHFKFEVGEGKTIARIKRSGKTYEIMVNLADAMKFRKGDSKYIQAETTKVFRDIKKGDVAGGTELENAFGTSDFQAIVEKIVKDGEIQTTQDYRDEEKEKKEKQVVDFLVRNAIDPQTKHPITPERMKNALREAHINIKNIPIENQIQDIIAQISKIIPIKLEVKKIRVTIPAMHTGRAYGIVAQYKESEEWLNDGSLETIIKVPSGLIMDFYDKLNSVTHGSALTEEIKE